MNRKLEEMSLKELWQLFPIFLVEHNKEWVKWYEEERKTILSIVPSKSIKRIAHIGSSAISGIWAKNIVDILHLKIEKCAKIKENNDFKPKIRCARD